jgi:microcystin-dependent protein
MSDIKINDIPLLTGALKGDATTVVVQNLDTRRITIQSLSAIIANAVPSDTPVGQVSFFATTVPPNGWIECKGTRLNIVGEFNELYKVIGHTFTDILNPSVDKTKYFYAPDLRGYFIRALDNGANVDEDVSRKLGSIQEDSIEKHTHNIQTTVNSGGVAASNYPPDSNTNPLYDVPTSETGGVETRPKNVALMACIKYSAAKGPATPVTPTNPTTNSGIDISTNSGNVGSVTGLKFTGNVDVTKTGDVATINVKSSGSGGRPNVLGFPVFKDSYWTRCVITDEPSLIGWGTHAYDKDGAWRNMDPYVALVNPPSRYRFDNFYLIDNPDLKIVKAISSVYFQCVLLSDGTLWVNGYDYADGRTGLGNKNNKSTNGFKKVNTNIKFSDFDISVDNDSGNISFAAIETGTKKLYTWGLNGFGQLGQGSTTVVDKPTLVSDNSTKAVRQVVFSAHSKTGESKLLVLYDDNTLYACGYNNYGQLGIGNTTNQTKLTQCKKNSTTLVSDAKRIVESGWGNYYNSGYISTSDEFYACGYNGVGNIGDGTKTNSSFFLKSNIPEKVKDVVTSSGYNYGTNYLALGMSGKMYSWGRNAHGQLGHGNTTEITSPKLIQSMSGIPIQKIFGYDGWGDGRAFGCLDTNGRVYMTGYNIPEPPDFLLSQSTTSYTRMNVPDKVVDMVLLGGDNNQGHFYAALFLTQGGKVFSFGHYSNIESNTSTSFPVEIRI